MVVVLDSEDERYNRLFFFCYMSFDGYECGFLVDMIRMVWLFVLVICVEKFFGFYVLGVVYIGWVFVEWVIVINECNSFVDCCWDEGVFGLVEVEIFIFGVDGFGMW